VLYYSQTVSSGNSALYSTNTADPTSSTGAMALVGPASGHAPGQFVMLGVNSPNSTTTGTFAHPVVAFGTSIAAGLGIQNFQTNLGSGDPARNSWFSQGFSALSGQYTVVNLSSPSSNCLAWTTQSLSTAGRAAILPYLYHAQVVTDCMTNDIFGASQSWTAAAANVQNVCKYVMNAGADACYVATILPRNGSSSSWLTLAGQTLSSYETARANANTWARNGFQFSSGTACNTASCGTASPYITGVIDDASFLGEVNSSGVATLNGGYWPIPSSASYSGLILSGTPTTTAFTVTTSPFTAGTLAGCTVLMTSGSASGQSALINSVTANTLTLYAANAYLSGVAGITTAPSAADTFSVYCANTVDGVHPSYTGHQLISTGGWASWIQSHLAN